MTTRAEQKAATKQRIVSTARSIFEDQGFEEAHIGLIAKAAGVASGTVMLHFADKRALLNAALYQDLQATVEHALTLQEDGPLEADLQAIFVRFMEYFSAHPKLSKTLLQESLFPTPTWSKRFEEQLMRIHERAIYLGEGAITRGELAPTADLPRIALAFLSFHHFALLAWLQGSHPDPAGLVLRLTTLALDGSRPTGGHQ